MNTAKKAPIIWAINDIKNSFIDIKALIYAVNDKKGLNVTKKSFENKEKESVIIVEKVSAINSGASNKFLKSIIEANPKKIIINVPQNSDRKFFKSSPSFTLRKANVKRYETII